MTTTVKTLDLTDMLMDYESGQLGINQIIELFAKLVSNGMVWRLQGHYGRMATALIAQGYIDRYGKIVRFFDPENA